MVIIVICYGIIFDELDVWGSVVDFGLEIFEGEVKVFGKMIVGVFIDLVSVVYFGIIVGKFCMIYLFSEQVMVVSGEVCFIDEFIGQSMFYKVGDSWFVSKGILVFWEVVDGGFVKYYYVVV